MTKIKNENYFQISGWMQNKLKLSGNQLIAYAIIYGFTQDGVSKFCGGLDYLASWMGVSKQSVIHNLNQLLDKNLIFKKVLEGGYREYSVNLDILNDGQKIPMEESSPAMKESFTAMKESSPAMKESSPNNNIYNNSNNKFNNNIITPINDTTQKTLGISSKKLNKSKVGVAPSADLVLIDPVLAVKKTKRGTKPWGKLNRSERYDAYMEVINDYTDNSIIKEKLLAFVNNYLDKQADLMRMPMRAIVFSKRLENLTNLCKNSDGLRDINKALKIINFSIENDYNDFYPVKDESSFAYSNKGKKFFDPTADNEKIDSPDFKSMTAEEIKKWDEENLVQKPDDMTWAEYLATLTPEQIEEWDKRANNNV